MSKPTSATRPLHLAFVYGTLKTNFPNHSQLHAHAHLTASSVLSDLSEAVPATSRRAGDAVLTPSPDDELVSFFVGEGTTVEKLRLTYGGARCVPYLMRDSDMAKALGDECVREAAEPRRVRGEVWLVSTAMLAALDEFEGVDLDYYYRGVVEVETSVGALSCGAYLLSPTSKAATTFGPALLEKEPLDNYSKEQGSLYVFSQTRGSQEA